MRQKLKVGRARVVKDVLRRLWHDVDSASGWKFWEQE
jgi:hypothetical protein